MGSSLSTYRRGPVSEESSTLKFKASIRPTTGIGLVMDGDGKSELNPGFPSGNGFTNSDENSVNGSGHQAGSLNSEPTNFVRNRKELLSMRSSKYSPKIPAPMPTTDELEKRFTKVLASMDLPPDKAKLLKQYDDHRKWEIVCDQELVQVREPPRFYLKKLQTYLDPKASRSFKKRKAVGESTSTQVLKDLEISLRTNNIEWVREFLNEENRGLDVLVDYLNFRLVMMRHEQNSSSSSPEHDKNTLSSDHSGSGSNFASNSGPNGTTTSLNGNHTIKPISSPTVNKRTSKHLAKLNMGDAKDDIHVCILCLRAIMNTKHGLNMVILKQDSINAIALSLRHKSLRTKALVLELLAAVCLVQGGHPLILRAFDNFKDVCMERRRFETLVDFFINYEFFYVEFMVACMQFINIVVHSVDDMNERVYLQYEFSQLGIDNYLERLRNTPSEELRVQISAYLDNVFDVAALMDDSETKNMALERVGELEEENSRMKEMYQKLESDHLSRMLELEQRIKEIIDERDSLLSKHEEITEEVTTLRRVVTQKEEEKKSMMERLSRNLGNGVTTTDSATPSSNVPAMPSNVNVNTEPLMKASVPAPPVPAPPPPPIPPFGPPPPGPPPPPPMMGGNMNNMKQNMTIKKALQPKVKLPTLNWTVLKPREVKGTVFNQLDDSKYYGIIDFDNFEKTFQIGSVGSTNKNTDESDGDGSLSSYPSKRFKKPEAISLLEHTRLRNIAISRRKLGLSIDVVVKAVNALDLTTLKLEQVEILQRMVPNEAEAKLYREYMAERKNPELLTEEDKFLLQLSRIERISTKLAVMAYIANFPEIASTIQPQVHSIIMASRAVRTSEKFHQVLEIILAFGNYLNGAKRGPAYGFKIQSLECLTDTKSLDRRQCLLHYISDTISNRYPNLSNFVNDLQFVEKASLSSLENVRSDLNDLEKGMELTKKESQFLMQKHEQNTVMRDFLSISEDKLNKIKQECKTAVKDFAECVEFYGEESQQIDTSGFFSAILKFIRAYKQAALENEQRKRVSMRNQSPPETLNKVNGKKQQQALLEPASQCDLGDSLLRLHLAWFGHDATRLNSLLYPTKDAVISELKRKQTSAAENNKKLQEVYHGALEDILSDLKNEPYRRADALRRSQRRKVNERLSRNFDDFEV